MNTLTIKEKEEVKDFKTGYCFVRKNSLVTDMYVLSQFAGWPDDPTGDQIRYVAINITTGFSWCGVQDTKAEAVDGLTCIGNVILTAEIA